MALRLDEIDLASHDSFTMDRYQHVMPTMQAQAADAIQAALRPR